MSDHRTRTRPRLVWVNLKFQRAQAQNQKRVTWDDLPVCPRCARAVLYIAEAAGCELWLNGPSLEINVPHSLPERLRSALLLQLGLNARAISTLLEGDDSA
jgi:hypothetical protein